MTNIRVELQLEDGSFTSGVMRAGQSLAEFKRELQRTDPHFRKLASNGQESFLQIKRNEEGVRTLGQRFRDLTVVVGGVSLAFAALSGASSSTIGNIIKINAELEKLKYQLSGMSDAADPMADAAAKVADLQRFANSTPFSLGQLATSFVKLKATGIDPMNGSLQALTDALAAFGASDEQLNRVTVAITQMQGKGVISMEELRQQLGESMPSAMRLFARSMGVSVGEFTKLVSTGTVEARSALDKFFKESQLSYGGTGALMMRSFSGQMAKIRTGLQKLVTGGEMGEAFEMLKEKMGDFSDWLNSQDARKVFDMFGAGFKIAIGLGESLVFVLESLKDAASVLGPSLIVGLGGVALMSTFTRIGNAVNAIKFNYASLATSANVVALALRNIHRGAAIGAGAAGQQVQNAATAAALAASQARSAGANSQAAALAGNVAMNGNRIWGPLLAGARGLLGMLGPIALGIGIIAPIALDVGKAIFGWGEAAGDAKKGMESAVEAAVRIKRDHLKQSVSDLEKAHAVEKAMLEKGLSQAVARNDAYFNRTGRNRPGDLREIGSYQARIDAFDAKSKAEMLNLTKNHEGELTEAVLAATVERVRKVEQIIAGQNRENSRDYDRQMNEASMQYEKDLEAAAKAGTSIETVKTDYRNKIVSLRKEMLGETISLYDVEIERQRKMAAAGEENIDVIARLIARRDELNDQRDGLGTEELTVARLTAPEDDKAKGERLERFFKSASEKVQELQAELNGASGAVAKLAFQIKRGDFGNLANARDDAKEMMEILLETTIQAEALDRAMKALDKGDTAIENVTSKLREEIAKNKAILAGVDPDDEVAYLKFQKENSIGIFEEIGRTGEQTMRTMTDAVTQGVDLAITSSSSLAQEIQTNAFGESSVAKINAVNDALRDVYSTTSAINNELLAVNFGKMRTPNFGGLGRTNINTNVDGGILDLIASVESRGDYNATLDNGRWTNGARNLTEMKLKDVRALQNYMLSHPENREKYGNGQGSSALGRYQIVGKTLQGLMTSMSLTGEELYDEKMQDAMARRLLNDRGGSASGLRAEWEGLNNVSDADIYASYDGSGVGPTRASAVNLQKTPVANLNIDPKDSEIIQRRQDSQDKDLREAERLRDENIDLAARAVRKKYLDDLNAASKGNFNEDGEFAQYGTKGREARARAAKGDFGSDQEAIDDIIARADAYDKEREAIKERASASREALTNDQQLNEELIEIEQRRQNALKRVNDPNFKGVSSELQDLAKFEREQLALVEKMSGGTDNDQYRAATARIAQQRRAIIGAEGAEALQHLTQAADDASRRSVTNERKLRKVEFDERIRELEALRDQAIRDGILVAEANKQFNRAVSAEREAYAVQNQTEFSRTLQQMQNFEDNMQTAASGWAKNLSDAIYSGDFSSIGTAVRESVARGLADYAAAAIIKPFESILLGDGTPGSGLSGIAQKAMDNLVGGVDTSGVNGLIKKMSGDTSSMFSKGGKGASAATGSSSSFVPVKHTGGIIGSGGGWGRSVPTSAFLGAPKFHTGGIIGNFNPRRGLNPSEVPIIAQRGEGVFTPEQMSQLGGTMNNQSFSINAPITVNGSAGTPDQNDDLARKIAQQSEQMFRGLVQQEMVRQMRPGGLMRSG